MRAPGVSRWDELAIAYPDEAVTTARTPEALAAERCRLRVAPFDEALAHLAAASSPEAAAGKLGLIANDLSRRRDRWLAGGETPFSGGPDSNAPSWSPQWLWIALPIAALLAGIPLLFGSIVGSLPGVILLGAVAIHFALDVRQRRIPESTADKQCSTCGYDLRGLRPAIPIQLMKGLNVGPSACPECGARWPLVPPGDYPEM